MASYATSREFGLVIPGSTSLRNSCLLSWSLSKLEYLCAAGIREPKFDVGAEGVGEEEDVMFFLRFSIAASMLSRSAMKQTKGRECFADSWVGSRCLTVLQPEEVLVYHASSSFNCNDQVV